MHEARAQIQDLENENWGLLQVLDEAIHGERFGLGAILG